MITALERCSCSASAVASLGGLYPVTTGAEPCIINTFDRDLRTCKEIDFVGTEVHKGAPKLPFSVWYHLATDTNDQVFRTASG